MPLYSSYKALRQDILDEKINCSQLVAHYLHQANENEHLNIYVEIFADEAIQKAKALDEKLKSNPEQIGKLFGMVISIKDVICYKDHQVSAASKILENFTSLYTATALEKLLDEDVIVIGRTNCDQFAMGSSNENSIYGPTRNYDDPSRVPGGSSGGSAVSVQADTCLAALGSDTGGSVRQPAAFCGLVGMKPTYGRISRYGLIAYASSFDQIGTLTHCVYDAALLIELMAGEDEFDASTSTIKVENYSKLEPVKRPLRIGYFKTALEHPSLSQEIKDKTYQFIQTQEQAGHTIESFEFPLLEYVIPTYYVLTTAEASSNLSRFDGVRFGFRDDSAKSLDELYLKSRTEGFSEEVKKRIMLGTFVLSADYYDAYYTKAQKVRQLIKKRMNHIFEHFDLIIMPTTATTAWEIGSTKDNPIAMYLSDIFTVLPNLSGIPAINLPIGKSEINGMAIGMQVFSNINKENLLFAFSKHVT